VSLPQRVPPLEPRPQLVPPQAPPPGFRWNVRRFILAVLLLAIATGLMVSWMQTITPAGIVIHHTGPVTDGEPVTMALLDQFHKARGFGAFYYGRIYHVGYHYIIFPDGRVVSGRPERLRGAHARHYNNYIGIVLVGDFSSRDNSRGQHGLEQPTEAQISKLVLLCRRLQSDFGIPLPRIVLHRDVGQTLCPGDRFPLGEVVSRLQIQPQPHSPPLR
jgi:N-acetyl-anhydromuramyl-L-alanine amidase AmpD